MVVVVPVIFSFALVHKILKGVFVKIKMLESGVVMQLIIGVLVLNMGIYGIRAENLSRKRQMLC